MTICMESNRGLFIVKVLTPSRESKEAFLGIILNGIGSFCFIWTSIERHWVIKRTTALQYFPFGDAVKKLHYENYREVISDKYTLRSLWLNHGSGFLMRGIVGSPPEPSTAESLAFPEGGWVMRKCVWHRAPSGIMMMIYMMVSYPSIIMIHS